jgi:hypothetical protein
MAPRDSSRARRAGCPTRTGFANIMGSSSGESGAPHRFRFASYANASVFRTPEVSQRGSPLHAPPVAFRSLPLCPISHKGKRLTANASMVRTASDAAATKHDSAHACSAFEVMSERNYSEPWAGCLVSLTTPADRRSQRRGLSPRTVWPRRILGSFSRHTCSVEASIGERVDAPSQGVEQGCYQEGGYPVPNSSLSDLHDGGH